MVEARYNLHSDPVSVRPVPEVELQQAAASLLPLALASTINVIATNMMCTVAERDHGFSALYDTMPHDMQIF